MDVLADVISLLRPDTVLLGAMAASGHWGVRVPPQPGPTFYFVTEGRCWFAAAGGEPVELAEGDCVLSSRPLSDCFMSRPGERMDLSDAAFKARHAVDGEIRVGDCATPDVTRIVGGLVLCRPANAGLLIKLLPEVALVSGEGPAGRRLRPLVDMIRDEAAAERPGREAILGRLIEVLLIETLRAGMTDWAPGPGLLRGLADPRLAAALERIHGDVGRNWRLDELARAVGMSRASFARHFTSALGLAPVEYLLDWRMALAKDALLRGEGPLERVAEAVGYRSASAFSTAFSRRIGCAPSDYAARHASAAA